MHILVNVWIIRWKENKIHFFFEKEEAFLEVITESIMNVLVPARQKDTAQGDQRGEARST